MSDITTVEEVDAGKYTVRVAQTDDGKAWEAAVIGKDSGKSGPSSLPGLMLSMNRSDGGNSGSDDESFPGTAVTAPHRWVAIGFAIESYEWSGADETPVDVDDAYKATDAELTLEPETKRALVDHNHATTFTGSFTLDTDDEDE